MLAPDRGEGCNRALGSTGAMDLKELALGWLPNTPTRAILLCTALLSTTPFLLPESLISEIHLPGQAQLWLLKVTVSLGVLLIGACVICFLVIYYYKVQLPRDDFAAKLREGRKRVEATKNPS